MINITQFTEIVLNPTLKEIPRGYSVQAEVLLLVIAAHESRGGTYLAQKGGGPARGIFQIEPQTHDTVWEHGATCKQNARLLGIECDSKRLFYDLKYQVFIARQRLFMIPEALPTKLDDICAYAKQYWNTAGGKATSMDYRIDYNRWSTTQFHK